jgi:hypothetical protein
MHQTQPVALAPETWHATLSVAPGNAMLHHAVDALSPISCCCCCCCCCQANNPPWYNDNLFNPNWAATIFLPSEEVSWAVKQQQQQQQRSSNTAAAARQQQ